MPSMFIPPSLFLRSEGDTRMVNMVFGKQAIWENTGVREGVSDLGGVEHWREGGSERSGRG